MKDWKEAERGRNEHLGSSALGLEQPDVRSLAYLPATLRGRQARYESLDSPPSPLAFACEALGTFSELPRPHV